MNAPRPGLLRQGDRASARSATPGTSTWPWPSSWTGEFDEAEPYLLEALKLGQSYQAHTNLGVVYYNTGRFEDAVREFRAAVEAGGTQVESLGGLGDALRQLGRKEEAAAAYRARRPPWLVTSCARTPRTESCGSALAMILAGAGRCAAAREEAVRAATPDGPPAVFSYTAAAYAICGDHSAAVREAIRALDGGAIVELRSNPDLERVRDDAGDPRPARRGRADSRGSYMPPLPTATGSTAARSLPLGSRRTTSYFQTPSPASLS